MVSSGLGSLSAFPPALARRFDPAPTLPALLALVDEYLADAESGRRRGWPSAYTVAKAALNALSRILAEGLGERARVNAVSPGWVRTRMGGSGAPKSLAEGVAGLVWAATLPADGPTGGFFEDGEALRW
jgi:NAD(P)-dependent dehydrogenase (short-subunit alcohol dehydrogenase family)